MRNISQNKKKLLRVLIDRVLTDMGGGGGPHRQGPVFQKFDKLKKFEKFEKSGLKKLKKMFLKFEKIEKV